MTLGILSSHIGCRMTAAVVAMILLLTSTTFGEEWLSAAPVPKGTEEVYGVAARGKLYVFGGLDLEEYDPSTDQWLIRAPMPTPRSATA